MERKKILFNSRIAWLVLLIGWGLAGVWWWQSATAEQATMQRELDRQTREIAQLIERSTQKYTQLLLGLRGFFEADRSVTRNAFHDYLSSIDLASNYPAVQAVQFARFVTAEQRTEYEARIRQDPSFSPEGFPSFAIHPPGQRPAYVVVEYNEPVQGNETTFGYDQIFEIRQREAMEKARDSGMPYALAPIQLIQDNVVRSGFVIHVPLYSKPHLSLSAQAHQTSYIGQLSSALVVEKILQSVLRMSSLETAQRGFLELQDHGWNQNRGGLTGVPATVKMSVSQPLPTQQNTDSKFGTQQNPITTIYTSGKVIDDVAWWQTKFASQASLDVAGRLWIFRVEYPKTTPILQQSAILKFLAVGFLATLLFVFLRQLCLAREHSNQRLSEYTGRLKASEERTAAVLESAVDGIAIISSTGVIRHLNPAFPEIFHTQAAALLGRNLIELIAPTYQEEYQRFLHSSATDGMAIQLGLLREIDGQRFAHDHTHGSLFPMELTLTVLSHSLDGEMVVVLRDVSERNLAAARLREMAMHDTLTGLPNRNVLTDRFQVATERAQRNGQRIGLMFLDLDRFKNINDSLGHQTGDQLLKVMGDRLIRAVRASDTVARMGGDEFVVLLPDLTGKLEVESVARKILTSISIACPLAGNELHVTPSIGIAFYPDDGGDLDTLLKHADTAMYRAKELGRNNYQFYRAEMSAGAIERLTLENDLRGAVLRNEFELYYQPQIDLRALNVIGLEALIRWQHPRLGIVVPNDFIPLAEETGLIVAIGDWVMRNSCKQVFQWNRERQQKNLEPLRLAVNLSPRQFRQRNLVESIQQTLKVTGLPAECLEIELTESVLLTDTEETIAVLVQLKMLGVRLAIDDFGVGYSNLAYLKRFPIDRLKIDRSFIRDISIDPDDAAIALAIISMAHSLKMNVVAEGIESGEHLSFLDSHHCDIGQGYYFAKPISAQELNPLTLNEMVQQM